jgi:acyl carrier protein
LFRRETAEGMLRHYRNLIEAMIRYPDRRVWDLPVLSDAERARMLQPWSSVAGAVPAEANVQRVIGGPEGIAAAPDLEACVAGSHGQILPAGATGELCIGGPGLARLLDGSDPTPERWLANPIREEPAARMYRTGDRARYLTDGKIEFAAGAGSTAQQPSESERAFEAPETSTERAMAAIWKEVLGAERVGRNDDFFSLGGHSVAAGQVIVGVRKQFKIKVKMVDLFRYPTVAGMAGLIDFALGAKNGKAKSATR